MATNPSDAAMNHELDAGLTVVWPNGRRWLAYAACAGADTDLFFRVDGPATEEALNFCRRCSVRAECLAFALVNKEWTGIWGGTDAVSRQRLRRPTRTRTPIASDEDIDGRRAS
jgi:WhiB family redox-sensing transcriptional regulator